MSEQGPRRLSDGRLLVQLRAEGPNGEIGEGLVPIGPDHPAFAAWEAHLRRATSDGPPSGRTRHGVTFAVARQIVAEYVARTWPNEPATVARKGAYDAVAWCLHLEDPPPRFPGDYVVDDRRLFLVDRRTGEVMETTFLEDPDRFTSMRATGPG